VKILDVFEWGSTGCTHTANFGEKKYQTQVSLEYTPPVKGIVKLCNFEVKAFNPKGQGLGTQAWKLFEAQFPKGTVFKGTAGYKNWSGESNRLANRFWEKMGFTAKAKNMSKPRRIMKVK
jgi:hypothetical protein